jgi:hypothetical protein
MPDARSAAMDIGIVGTFDVQNLGDLLFPIVAETELSRRLGPLRLHRFSYHEKHPPDWPYRVETVAALPGRAGDLDALLIGGGHLIRFDKAVAPGYGPPSPDIHHPTGYWLMPALFAAQHGCPVVWNAVETWREVPDWAAPLLRTALKHSSYVAVRHAHSRDDLLPYANGTPIEVVPDTCFGIAGIVDPTRPSNRYRTLRREVGLRPPYIVIQATPHQAGFVRFVRRHRARFAGYQFLSVPVGPALGDHDGALAELEDLLTLPSWPDPTVLAEVIAGSGGVVGTSLHLAIIAMSFGLPVFRPDSIVAGKYAPLAQYETVHTFGHDGDIGPEWFQERLDRRGLGSEMAETLRALQVHWDRVAASVSAPRGRTMGALDEFAQQLPVLLEARAQLSREGELLLAHVEAAAGARDSELADARTALSARDAEVGRLAATLRARDEEIRQFRQSTSWRLTAPLRWAKRLARGGVPDGAIIRFDSFDRQPLQREPYDWAFVNRLFGPRDARSLVESYPRDHVKTVKGYDGEKGYEYEARALIYLGGDTVAFPEELSHAWRRLARDLLAPAYRRTLSRFLGRDLTTAPMEAYVCHFGPGAWLGPHVDLKEKIITHVFYFNAAWDPKDGGCLNILRSSNMADSIAEITPIVGNSSVLVRAQNSWHSVSRVVAGCPTSRRSMNVIFYHPGAVSTMWPPGDNTPLHRYEPSNG